MCPANGLCPSVARGCGTRGAPQAACSRRRTTPRTDGLARRRNGHDGPGRRSRRGLRRPKLRLNTQSSPRSQLWAADPCSMKQFSTILREPGPPSGGLLIVTNRGAGVIMAALAAPHHAPGRSRVIAQTDCSAHQAGFCPRFGPSVVAIGSRGDALIAWEEECEFSASRVEAAFAPRVAVRSTAAADGVHPGGTRKQERSSRWRRRSTAGGTQR